MRFVFALLLALAGCDGDEPPDGDGSSSGGVNLTEAMPAPPAAPCPGDECEGDKDCGGVDGGMVCFRDLPKQAPFCAYPCGDDIGSCNSTPQGDNVCDEHGVCRTTGGALARTCE